MKHFLNLFVFALVRVLNIPFLFVSKILNIAYQIYIPSATYAPWLKDKLFLSTFKEAKKNSLVNFYQAYELWSLVEQAEKIEGDVLEVGVWRGSTSILMGTKLKHIGSRKTIYACDTFEGVVKTDKNLDPLYKDGEHKNTSLPLVQNLIKQKFQLSNIVCLKGIFPEETQHLIDKKQFSFCHIDVDTYTSAKDVVEWVWGRLKKGGIIVFNDYGFPRTSGITQLVNAYKKDKDKIVIHNLNGHGIMVKY